MQMGSIPIINPFSPWLSNKHVRITPPIFPNRQNAANKC